ncbi:MAG: trypsin-like serine protease [Cyclobacteriaceae bacterium]
MRRKFNKSLTIKLAALTAIMLFFGCESEIAIDSLANEPSMIPDEESAGCSVTFTGVTTNDQMIIDQQSSVGLMYYKEDQQYNSLCSGTLVNNEAGRLYFLTAAHCLIDQLRSLAISPFEENELLNDQISDQRLSDIINQGNTQYFNDWRVEFFYTCEDPGNSFSIFDLELKAVNFTTDMALFDLRGYVTPSNKERLRLSGWTRSTNTTSSFDIHHVKGSCQTLATSSSDFEVFNNSEPFEGFVGSAPRSNFWLVNFDQRSICNKSSGSGLINSNGQLVGQLSVGDKINTANGLPDKTVFGRFDLGWYKSALPGEDYDQKRSTKHWLSPNNNQSMGAHSFATPVAGSNLIISHSYPPGMCGGPPSLHCGRTFLNWTAGEAVYYKVYRRVNYGPEKLLATLTESQVQYQDLEVRDWLGNNSLRYRLASFRSSNNTIVANAIANTTGGLLNY